MGVRLAAVAGCGPGLRGDVPVGLPSRRPYARESVAAGPPRRLAARETVVQVVVPHLHSSSRQLLILLEQKL